LNARIAVPLPSEGGFFSYLLRLSFIKVPMVIFYVFLIGNLNWYLKKQRQCRDKFVYILQITHSYPFSFLCGDSCNLIGHNNNFFAESLKTSHKDNSPPEEDELPPPSPPLAEEESSILTFYPMSQEPALVYWDWRKGCKLIPCLL
jgi:hypothetical protein